MQVCPWIHFFFISDVALKSCHPLSGLQMLHMWMTPLYLTLVLMFLCFQTCIFISKLVYLSIYRYLIGTLTLTWLKQTWFFFTNICLSSSSFLVKGTTAITIYRVASEDSMKDSWGHLFPIRFAYSAHHQVSFLHFGPTTTPLQRYTRFIVYTHDLTIHLFPTD